MLLTVTSTNGFYSPSSFEQKWLKTGNVNIVYGTSSLRTLEIMPRETSTKLYVHEFGVSSLTNCPHMAVYFRLIVTQFCPPNFMEIAWRSSSPQHTADWPVPTDEFCPDVPAVNFRFSSRIIWIKELKSQALEFLYRYFFTLLTREFMIRRCQN